MASSLNHFSMFWKGKHSRWKAADTIMSSVFQFKKGVNTINDSSNPDIQVGALKDFYLTTSGPDWNSKSNWMTPSSVATWYGVDCDSEGNVVSLELGNNNLNGIQARCIRDVNPSDIISTYFSR